MKWDKRKGGWINGQSQKGFDEHSKEFKKYTAYQPFMRGKEKWKYLPTLEQAVKAFNRKARKNGFKRLIIVDGIASIVCTSNS